MNKRINAYIIAGILSLTGVGEIQYAFADSQDTINSEIKNQDFVTAAYPNILRPISEWKFKHESFSFSDVNHFEMILNGRRVILAGRIEQQYYLKNENSKTDIKLSDVDKKRYMDNYNKLKLILNKSQFEKLDDFGVYMSFNELSSKMPAFVNVICLSNIQDMNPVAINSDFISTDKYNEGILGGIDINTFINTFSEADLISFGLTKDVLSGDKLISREEYVEIYKKIIPRSYWPIIEPKKINVNPSIPKIKKEILEMPIDDRLFIIRGKAKSGVKYILATYDDNVNEVDFISGERLISGEGKMLDLSKTGIITMDNYTSYDFVDGESWFLYNLPEYFEDFEMVETYGDAIDFIQKFPIEEQRDYSTADFSKSLVIDDGKIIENLPKILYRRP